MSNDTCPHCGGPPERCTTGDEWCRHFQTAREFAGTKPNHEEGLARLLRETEAGGAGAFANLIVVATQERNAAIARAEKAEAELAELRARGWPESWPRPAVMDAPDGPVCGCGAPSEYLSGLCDACAARDAAPPGEVVVIGEGTTIARIAQAARTAAEQVEGPAAAALLRLAEALER